MNVVDNRDQDPSSWWQRYFGPLIGDVRSASKPILWIKDETKRNLINNLPLSAQITTERIPKTATTTITTATTMFKERRVKVVLFRLSGFALGLEVGSQRPSELFLSRNVVVFFFFQGVKFDCVFVLV